MSYEAFVGGSALAAFAFIFLKAMADWCKDDNRDNERESFN